MRYPYVFVLALFLGLSTFGQSGFKKAVFKPGNSTIFLADLFNTLSGAHNKGNGTVVVGFTLTKNGEIKGVHPVKFDTQKNAVNAILAVQKTNKNWTPTLNNGVPVNHKYKIAYTFVSANNSYELDVKMADKFAKKKLFKQALKYYNRAIKSNENEASLYLSRAEVKLALNDMEGLKKDLLKCKALEKEFLANVQLSLIKSNIKEQLTYINKEK